MNEGRRGFQNRFIRFSHNCGFKKQKHQFTRFHGWDFNFTHFANFKLKKVSLGKITKWPISHANFHFGYLKSARLIFVHFVYNRNFGQI